MREGTQAGEGTGDEPSSTPAPTAPTCPHTHLHHDHQHMHSQHITTHPTPGGSNSHVHIIHNHNHAPPPSMSPGHREREREYEVVGGGWRERDRERDREEVPHPAMSSGRGYMNVPATNNDCERDQNVGMGSSVGMGMLHPSLASPNPPPLLSSSYASRRGSWDRGVNKGGVHGPYHSTPAAAEHEREQDRERGYGNLGGPQHQTRNPAGRCTAMDPRAQSYPQRQTWCATRLRLSPTLA